MTLHGCGTGSTPCVRSFIFKIMEYTTNNNFNGRMNISSTYFNEKPKSNEIWNNKFEAANVDGTDKNTKLTATTFIKQGGGEISDMMMVREVYQK